jgi:hypothetical protein
MSRAEAVLKLMTQYDWIVAYGEGDGPDGQRRITLGVLDANAIPVGVIPSELDGIPVVVKQIAAPVAAPAEDSDLDMFDL